MVLRLCLNAFFNVCMLIVRVCSINRILLKFTHPHNSKINIEKSGYEVNGIQ